MKAKTSRMGRNNRKDAFGRVPQRRKNYFIRSLKKSKFAPSRTRLPTWRCILKNYHKMTTAASLPRKVTLRAKLDILRSKPIPAVIGLAFTFVPLLIGLILAVVFAWAGNDVPRVDYEAIDEGGKDYRAKVTAIEIQHSIRINGVSPAIISYTYLEGGKETASRSRILSKDALSRLEVGDTLRIRALSGESFIKDIEPYSFSVAPFLLFPIPFLILGGFSLLYTLRRLKAEVSLYEYGDIIKAKVIAVTPRSGTPLYNFGSGLDIHYEYEIPGVGKRFGQSFARDISFMSGHNDGSVAIFVSKQDTGRSSIVPRKEAARSGWGIGFD